MNFHIFTYFREKITQFLIDYKLYDIIYTVCTPLGARVDYSMYVDYYCCIQYLLNTEILEKEVCTYL